ncbi:hypothetical protein C5468_16195 [Photorhabdus luminescens subsp. mexicana]|uniref:Uncharacterized protein n=1 Tax=Photorhabdus luminescens subsp. mexicana TaxID=2100167 RepID=A0A4V2X5J3_PHOLU|nr:hypothetical protein C5468_16195 [Photorhabdus luminescens subsp. mexicana]
MKNQAEYGRVFSGFFITLIRSEIKAPFYEGGFLLIDKLFGNTLLSDRNNLKDNYFESFRIISDVIN